MTSSGHTESGKPAFHGPKWVRAIGVLPPYLERITQYLYSENQLTIHAAVETGIRATRQWCSNGLAAPPCEGSALERISPRIRAQACASMAQWNSRMDKTPRTADSGEEAQIRCAANEIAEILNADVKSGIYDEGSTPAPANELRVSAEEIAALAFWV